MTSSSLVVVVVSSSLLIVLFVLMDNILFHRVRSQQLPSEYYNTTVTIVALRLLNKYLIFFQIGVDNFCHHRTLIPCWTPPALHRFVPHFLSINVANNRCPNLNNYILTFEIKALTDIRNNQILRIEIESPQFMHKTAGPQNDGPHENVWKKC